MRTTVRLDDDLFERLKAEAHKENVSLTQLLNRTLRGGLQRGTGRPHRRPSFRERAHALGAPRILLDKALALAAALEDEEIVRELASRK